MRLGPTASGVVCVETLRTGVERGKSSGPMEVCKSYSLTQLYYVKFN